MAAAGPGMLKASVESNGEKPVMTAFTNAPAAPFGLEMERRLVKSFGAAFAQRPAAAFILSALWGRLAERGAAPEPFVRQLLFTGEDARFCTSFDLFFPALRLGVNVDESALRRGRMSLASGRERLADEEASRRAMRRAAAYAAGAPAEAFRILSIAGDDSRWAVEQGIRRAAEAIEAAYAACCPRVHPALIDWLPAEARIKAVRAQRGLSTDDPLFFESLSEVCGALSLFGALGDGGERGPFLPIPGAADPDHLERTRPLMLWVPGPMPARPQGLSRKRPPALCGEAAGFERVVERLDGEGAEEAEENRLPRAVFLRFRDGIGIQRLKFFGVFEPAEIENRCGALCRIWRRTGKRAAWKAIVS